MTIDDDARLSGRRVRREPKRWPYGLDSNGVPGEGAQIAAAFLLIAQVALLLGLLGYHSSLYHQAGAGSVCWIGGASAQFVVLAVMLIAATLYRWGHRLRTVLTVAVVAAVVAVGFALLPHLAAGKGWVMTLLGTLFTLAVDAVLAAEVTLAAVYLPMWWTGWHWQFEDAR